jgi:hypothetical protein
MLKVTRVVVVAAVATGLLLHGAANAATPTAGTISKAKKSVSWSGGPFTLSEPTLDSDCNIGGADDPICDHFSLTVNLGDSANIEVAIKTPRPCTAGCLAQPAEGDDYDLFVYGPDGSKVAEKATPAGNEKLVFKHRGRFRGKPYEVRVTPWAVLPGSTYKGTVRAVTVGR